MKHNRSLGFLGWPALLMLLSTLVLAPRAGSESQDKDRLPVRRFPGSQVLKSFARELDEYWLPLGKLMGDGQAEKFEVLEGRWTHFACSNPPNHSVIEIYKHYEEALTVAGFEIVYACKDAECGTGGRKSNGDWWDPTIIRRYLVAKVTRPRGTVWVCLNVEAKNTSARGRHDLDVIETKPEAQPAERDGGATDPATMAEGLARAGHVTLYGIRFDPGKATVSAESAPMLRAIGELLVRQPKLKLYVVVHTDDAGGLASNLDLSRRQAAALVTVLHKQHRVPAARIRGEGLGPLAPVASNVTEEGRAKNRRVELVAQPQVSPAATLP